MLLLRKIFSLIKRSEAYQARCERRIFEQERKIIDIQNKIKGFDAEIKSLKAMLQAQKPQGVVLDRGDFFAYLRKQAALRRKVQQLLIQQIEWRDKEKKEEAEKEKAVAERRFWQKKQDKYQLWRQKLRREIRLANLIYEENEAQEVITWRM